MRRLVLAIIVSMLAIAIGLGIAAAGAQQRPRSEHFETGVLGATRGEIEAEYGRVEKPITVPGHPIYDETFAYELDEATLYVTYRDVNDELTAVYAELAWEGDGIDEPAARAVVQNLLPVDAKLTELYVAPPTSSGPVALVTERYESASLGEDPTLAPEVLVIFQQQWGDPTVAQSTRVLSVSISIRERTQATG
jgi:hypothetical protein